MKILVSGGAGFIGSNVVERMLAEGLQVAILDNLSSGSKRNLHPGATFYHADIGDEEQVFDVLEREKPDFVAHHAAQIDVRYSMRDPSYDVKINILGSLNLIRAAMHVHVKKFIYASTGGAIYGDPDYLPADEEHAVNPISPYGISKHTVEHYLYSCGKVYGLPWTVLRYPNVYGPRQTPHGEAGVVAIFASQFLSDVRPTIFGKGDKARDYCFVGDIVEGNVLALTRGEGEIINLGTGVPTTDQQVFDTVRDAVGARHLEPVYAEERPGEVRYIYLDATKAKRLLGWTSKVSFKEGIERSVDYYYRYHRETSGTPVAKMPPSVHLVLKKYDDHKSNDLDEEYAEAS